MKSWRNFFFHKASAASDLNSIISWGQFMKQIKQENSLITLCTLHCQRLAKSSKSSCSQIWTVVSAVFDHSWPERVNRNFATDGSLTFSEGLIALERGGWQNLAPWLSWGRVWVRPWAREGQQLCPGCAVNPAVHQCTRNNNPPKEESIIRHCSKNSCAPPVPAAQPCVPCVEGLLRGGFLFEYSCWGHCTAQAYTLLFN